MICQDESFCEQMLPVRSVEGEKGERVDDEAGDAEEEADEAPDEFLDTEAEGEEGPFEAAFRTALTA